MHVIAVVMQKGGVGKTTTTINLSGCLTELRRKTLVIDFDPQGNASDWLLGPGPLRLKDVPITKQSGMVLKEALLNGEGLEPLIQSTEYGIDIVPNSPRFTGFENAGKAWLLKSAISKLPPRWDYVFIDCPPSVNMTTVNALVAAQGVVVPIAAGVLELSGVWQLNETIEEVREHLNDSLTLHGAFACQADQRTRISRDVGAALKEHFGNDFFSTTVRYNVKLREAPGHQKPIHAYDRNSSGYKEFRALAKELDSRVMGKERRRAGNE